MLRFREFDVTVWYKAGEIMQLTHLQSAIQFDSNPYYEIHTELKVSNIL
jgi:hypothetical protein